MAELDVKRLTKEFEEKAAEGAAKDERVNRIDHYASPYKYNFKYEGHQTENQDLPNDIYETTMIESKEIFSSGLHTQLTNPSTEWFTLSTQDPAKMRVPKAPEWFRMLEERANAILAGSNFYNQIHEAYDDLASGNMILYREDDPFSLIRYTAIPPVTCYFEEDETGRVRGMYRVFKFSPYQIVGKWGDRCSKRVKDAFTAGKRTKFDIIHIVRPRWYRDISKRDSLNKAFESIYFEKDGKTLLSVSGYDTFPFFTGRYKKNSGQVYGYGPGDIAIYSTKMLNQFMLTMIRRAQKEVDPPMSVPSDSFVLPILTDPSAINYRISGDPADKIEQYPPMGSAQIAFEVFKLIREQIRSAFHVDLFLAISDKTKRMTVPEVQEVIAEKMPLLGSALSRVMDEIHSPVIEDIVKYIIDKELIPPPPDAIAREPYKIVFVSPLAKAQKITQARSVQGLLAFAGQIAQLSPASLDIFDFDEIAKSVPEITGSRMTFLRDAAELQKHRELKAQAQAEELRKAELMNVARGAADASKADLNLAKAQQSK